MDRTRGQFLLHRGALRDGDVRALSFLAQMLQLPLATDSSASRNMCNSFGSKADIWQLGILCYLVVASAGMGPLAGGVPVKPANHASFLQTGGLPFGGTGEMDLPQAILSAVRIYFPLHPSFVRDEGGGTRRLFRNGHGAQDCRPLLRRSLHSMRRLPAQLSATLSASAYKRTPGVGHRQTTCSSTPGSPPRPPPTSECPSSKRQSTRTAPPAAV